MKENGSLGNGHQCSTTQNKSSFVIPKSAMIRSVLVRQKAIMTGAIDSYVILQQTLVLTYGFF